MNRYNKTPVGTNFSSSGRKIHLQLTGFSQQSYFSIDRVVQAVDVLPAFHLEGLREISYLSNYQARIELIYSPNPDFVRRRGAFIQRERRIIIYNIDSPALFFHVLYHEIGHYVFFLTLSSVVKKQWVTQIFPKSDCVTVYASTNPSEDFAESYACYVREPERLATIPKKFAFMRDHVFSGAPHTLKEKNQ